MEKLYNFNFPLYLTLYLLGGAATFSLPPFSIVPSIFILGFGIYIVSKLKAFKKIFFAQMLTQLVLLPPLGHKEAIGTLGYPIASKLEQ